MADAGIPKDIPNPQSEVTSSSETEKLLERRDELIGKLGVLFSEKKVRPVLELASHPEKERVQLYDLEGRKYTLSNTRTPGMEFWGPNSWNILGIVITDDHGQTVEEVIAYEHLGLNWKALQPEKSLVYGKYDDTVKGNQIAEIGKVINDERNSRTIDPELVRIDKGLQPLDRVEQILETLKTATPQPAQKKPA